ncbi:RagB/SusD family nutrient uptake outer membrane protein [Elizabethkingia sp. JS20170427COW]|uniref:RagB/SusD family nutrient uptake outer membrane protein n=1 Tax=Elizabethkingia sp. JS20170427COW TaxID=2583851 RepID=UPI0011108353|nr:RagB/SusD family nutrient uptake outer membrane protein [Elizabethkingia sp. JS20170427COW]QCX54261.1 RagB/SusD family nutrient uptake outer membrane protein [Elizabethkingia sp. JS20170427COW]
MKTYIKYGLLTITILGTSISCDDFLDREPLDKITPNVYFKNEADLAAYTVSMYNFPTHGGYGMGTFGNDNGTDNQASPSASTFWLPGQYRVGTTGGAWDFGRIRNVNYFLTQAEANLASGSISGNATNIKHYIGEGYFLRAYEYFNKLKTLGDFPIITEVLNDDKASLIEASKRRPRNEVARFIIQDLDKAINMLKSGSVENKNRISREVALLLKSRVALYEGSWEKYHQNTAFVPGGPNWPGAKASYLSNFFINLNSEINYFLEQAMSASKEVADMYVLTPNTHTSVSGRDIYSNSYFRMFSDINMSQYSEVLLWRQYSSQYVSHHTQGYLQYGGSSGFTRGLVESFLMKNGLPIYATGSGYQGDATLEDVRENRDERLQMFLQVPGDALSSDASNNKEVIAPNILDIRENRSITGYMIKKGLLGDVYYFTPENNSINGSLVFRATEAYLNYIEASYIKTGNLDSNALAYWQKLRARAGLPTDINITINATNMALENDWAKYSAGQVIDKTLYNIRRERRNELIAEGMRLDDLKRWRALDQVKDYQVEGFNLWDSMYSMYQNTDGTSKLRYEPSANPNVSPKTNSKYLRPYQIVSANNLYYNGYNFTQAHYLSPIAYQHFLISSDGNPNNSVIYQNPYWPITAGGTPTSN